MKKNDNKHKLALQDVYLYKNITSYILKSSFDCNIESPFKYDDGSRLDIIVENDVITGIGQRDFQRNRLLETRGYLLLLAHGYNYKVVGKYSKVKKSMILYLTEKVLPEEIKVLNLIQKHLIENGIDVIVELDEKKRYHNEIRRRKGDKVQRRHL